MGAEKWLSVSVETYRPIDASWMLCIMASVEIFEV
jgi:hypothetical protein